MRHLLDPVSLPDWFNVHRDLWLLNLNEKVVSKRKSVWCVCVCLFMFDCWSHLHHQVEQEHVIFKTVPLNPDETIPSRRNCTQHGARTTNVDSIVIWESLLREQQHTLSEAASRWWGKERKQATKLHRARGRAIRERQNPWQHNFYLLLNLTLCAAHELSVCHIMG